VANSPDIDARRVDAVLRRALELDSIEERTAFLDKECRGEPAVRDEVDALLASEQASAVAMEKAMGARDSAVLDAIEAVEEDDAGRLAGTRIGSYRIASLIATGGMGAVYRAERADGQFAQTVAIKILPGWAADAQTVARLRAERQILSSLQHPYITQLLSGGETPDGVPYLVTKFIDGIPITDYVDRHRISIDERLDLFCKLANAVHYAHTKLVVHRDIKPSNILVDADGRPHLLDFGIAKLLDPGLAEMTVLQTVAGFSPMTMRYASPEQLRGEPVTTASDIFQLGLLLYRLVAGSYPEPGTAESVGLPPAPSRVAGNDARIHKDLDTIVLKALRVEPGDRYASATELADDIRRYRRGDAINARPESAFDLVKRLVRRNPVGTFVTIATVGLVIGWGISLQVYSERVASERDVATQQAVRAERVKVVLTDIYRRQDPLQQDTISSKNASLWDSLDAAVDRAEEQLDEEPDIQAELYGVFAGIYVGAGQIPSAIDVTRRAADIYAALGDAWLPELASTKARLAGLLLDTDEEAALAWLTGALDIVDRVEPRDPAAAVAVYLQAGYAMYNASNWPAAIDHFDAARRIFEQHDLQDAPQNIEILFGLGRSLIENKRLTDAEPLLVAALELGEQTLGPDDTRLNGIRDALSSLDENRRNP
jgi:serine/threonine protein kinase